MRRLEGKTALVTGATRGLGRTIAEWLAREGATLVVSGRRPEEVAAVVESLQETGARAYGVAADLSLVPDMHRLAQEALACVDRLDILVNNAGMSIRGHFWEVTDADWEYQVNVNFRAPFVLSQRVARHMIERGVRGRIVNISTVGAHLAHADAAVYDAAKAAVEAMTRNLAFELAPYGISVNCVAPGAIMERPGVDPDPASWTRYARNNIPFGRVGRAEDIAAAVLFFCVPETEFTTGQVLVVDGAHTTYIKEEWH